MDRPTQFKWMGSLSLWTKMISKRIVGWWNCRPILNWSLRIISFSAEDIKLMVCWSLISVFLLAAFLCNVILIFFIDPAHFNRFGIDCFIWIISLSVVFPFAASGKWSNIRAVTKVSSLNLFILTIEFSRTVTAVRLKWMVIRRKNFFHLIAPPIVFLWTQLPLIFLNWNLDYDEPSGAIFPESGWSLFIDFPRDAQSEAKLVIYWSVYHGRWSVYYRNPNSPLSSIVTRF